MDYFKYNLQRAQGNTTTMTPATEELGRISGIVGNSQELSREGRSEALANIGLTLGAKGKTANIHPNKEVIDDILKDCPDWEIEM